jgi:hypothetical protein
MATKDELIKSAISAGFKSEELDGLTKTELVALLEESAGQNPAEEKESEVIDDLKGFKGGKIHVHKKIVGGSEYIRTFSEEVHGEDFLDLAKSFQGKTKDRVFVK